MTFKERIEKKTGLQGPGGYQIIGNVLLLKLRKMPLSQKRKIARAILDIFPYVKTVCEIKSVGGELRKPNVVKLTGDGTETVHKEHNILYKLDVSKIMFSKGNLFERQRLISQVKENEVVVDMFAGIGYFSLSVAKKAKEVYAIEKNKVAFRYLKENISLNKAGNIHPILGDNRRIAEKLAGKADRVIMGYFPGTEKFLPYALMMLKKNGIIHYHNIYKESELWKKPINEIKKIGAIILEKRKVKSYAPRVWHVVLDVKSA
ncbi:MAG: class I SAM-dependent methyltransferase family protein [Candidatus Aenigmatarchaeota archaeon]